MAGGIACGHQGEMVLPLSTEDKRTVSGKQGTLHCFS